MPRVSHLRCPCIKVQPSQGLLLAENQQHFLGKLGLVLILVPGSFLYPAEPDELNSAPAATLLTQPSEAGILPELL